MKQPIKIRGHSLIDYAFLGATVAAPVALGLTGPARAVPVAFGATQGLLNATTDQPYAIKRVVSFKNHGRVESLAVPALAIAAATTGALRQPRAKAYFAGLLGALGAVYALTDWDA